MLGAHPRPRHPRITIGIGEINIPRDEHVLVVGAPRRQDQRAQDNNLKDVKANARKPPHKIDNRKSKIENRK
jgi:hypothetical protein